MAAYDLEEQEQLSALRDWWEKNSNRVTWVVLACALVLLAWTGWHRYQTSQATETGVLYAAIQQADQAKDAVKLRALTDEIVAKHAESVLAQMATLMLAKAEADAGNQKDSQARLEWAINKGSDTLVRDVARLRLAALQADAKDNDVALKTLEAAPDKAFTARFEDLRGDILFAKGDAKAAGEAYKRAMTALGENSGQASAGFRTVLQTKLDALGGA